MKVVSARDISGKKILLRYDLDVALEKSTVADDFRLKAGLETIKLCLENASLVILMGHIGRPSGRDLKLSVEPIYDWLFVNGFKEALESRKLKLLENLRFEEGEDKSDPDYAKQLASFGNFYINEAFAAYHPAASTTVLPKLLPHAAGLHFAAEVEKLTKIKNNPERPLLAIIGGAKVEDKLPIIEVLAKTADAVLVGGKLPTEIKAKNITVPYNVFVAALNEEGSDITAETVTNWANIIKNAKEIIWNGPLGLVEDGRNDKTKAVAQLVIDSEAQAIVGGGDTVAALDKWGMLGKFSFVSTGGGAMLKFLETGTLPTIEALR